MFSTGGIREKIHQIMYSYLHEEKPKKILAWALDGDGCLFNPLCLELLSPLAHSNPDSYRPITSEDKKRALIQGNLVLFKKMLESIIESEPTHVRLIIGSNRQSREIDINNSSNKKIGRAHV